ncbi:hypothetical protein JXB37_03235 [candidate division WOR-3 bacterium]|nr:hypothetical protein [candidate division WOR-3 bacterium]
MRHGTIAVLLLAAGGLALAQPGAPPDTAPARTRFPRLELAPLDGSRTLLPDSLRGRVFWVVFAFRRQDQSVIDTWLPWLDRAGAEDSTSRFFEVPLMGPSIPRLLRGVISAGMKVTVPADKHAHLAPYYGDFEQLADELGLADRAKVYIFLVGPDGFIAGRTEGNATEERARELLDTARSIGHTGGDGADE